MELTGRLSSLPLADVLHLIDSRGLTGKLRLKNGAQTSELYLDRGRLLFTSRMMDPYQVGLHLTHLGHLSRKDLLGWKATLKRGKKQTTADFFPGQDIPEEAWQQALNWVLQDDTLTIFCWNDGEFEFATEAITLPEGLQLNLLLRTYITQATEQVNRWKEAQEKLPVEDVVPSIVDYTRLETVLEVPLKGAEWKILARINGRRSLQALSCLTGLSALEVCEAVLRLVDKRLVSWVTPPPIQDFPAQIEESLPESGKGLLQRWTSREKGDSQAIPRTAVSAVTLFVNRLLERLAEESPEDFNARPFLQNHWTQLCSHHPLLDWFSCIGAKLQCHRLEEEPSRWEDAEACEEVILEGLNALQELVELIYHEMNGRLGEKKALQTYRREYEQIFRPDAAADMLAQLSLLSLIR